MKLKSCYLIFTFLAMSIFAGDIETVKRGQFEVWLDIAGLDKDEKKEIMSLPRVRVGEPFVLESATEPFAALSHFRYDSGGYGVEIVKVVYDFRKDKK